MKTSISLEGVSSFVYFCSYLYKRREINTPIARLGCGKGCLSGVLGVCGFGRGFVDSFVLVIYEGFQRLRENGSNVRCNE